jgi:hypothetical protein
LENLVVYDRVILKLMLQEKNGRCGLDLVAQDREQWWTVVCMVLDHCVAKNIGNFMTDRERLVSQEGLVPLGVME